MMSGVGSGVQYGQFKGLLEKSDRMAVTYKSQNGDSGAPVSTIGSGVKLYGMHTSNGIYSYSTPYKTIKTDLGLA